MDINMINFLKEERAKLQREYFEESRKVWLEHKGKGAEKSHELIYNNYKAKDELLRDMQNRLEENIK